MKNIKYEPGPWILGGCSGRMITTPSGYVGDGFIADVDTLANARLIAAAPELLEFVIQFRDSWDEGIVGDSKLIKGIADRLIAKATGNDISG